MGAEKGKDVWFEAEEMIRESLRLEFEFKKQIRLAMKWNWGSWPFEAEMMEKLKETHQVLHELEDELFEKRRYEDI